MEIIMIILCGILMLLGVILIFWGWRLMNTPAPRNATLSHLKGHKKPKMVGNGLEVFCGIIIFLIGGGMLLSIL